MFKKLLLAAVTTLALSSQAQAGFQLNLTAGGSGSFTPGIDFFQTTDQQPTGSGVIHSFVRIQGNNGIVKGFNTDGPLLFDENTSGTFTHSLLLSAVPTVSIGGVLYREFLLDINQTSNEPLLTLTQLQIFTGGSGAPTGGLLSGETLGFNAGQASLVYNMNAGAGGNSVLMDYNLNSGSGSGDLFVYVRDSLFSGTFVTLYSKFGTPPNALNNDGYEEWAVREGGPTTVSPVPVPPSIVMSLAGIGILGFYGYRRRNRLAVA